MGYVNKHEITVNPKPTADAPNRVETVGLDQKTFWNDSQEAREWSIGDSVWYSHAQAAWRYYLWVDCKEKQHNPVENHVPCEKCFIK